MSSWRGCGPGRRRGRRPVDKLISAGLLDVIAFYGKSRRLDPAAVATLASAPFIAPPQPGTALRGLVVHTNALAPDNDPYNGRPYSGWSSTKSAGMSTADRQKAWGAWWNTGPALAADVKGLLRLKSTSGWIGEVQMIAHAHPHPTRAGLTWFETVPASEQVTARYAGQRLTPAPGAPWQRR